MSYCGYANMAPLSCSFAILGFGASLRPSVSVTLFLCVHTSMCPCVCGLCLCGLSVCVFVLFCVCLLVLCAFGIRIFG